MPKEVWKKESVDLPSEEMREREEIVQEFTRFRIPQPLALSMPSRATRLSLN